MSEEKRVPAYSFTMNGLSHFFARLDPTAIAGVDLGIHNQGIMISVYIPESQLKNMLVLDDF